MTTEECWERQAAGGWWEDILANRCTFPIAPVNTWTNTAYMAVGALLVLLVETPAARIEGVFLGLLGIGSGIYHGFKTHFGGTCDDAGMFLVFGSLATYAYAPTSPWTPFAMAVSGGSLAVWRFASEEPAKHVPVLLGAFVGGVAMRGLLLGHLGWTLAGLGLLAVAYLVPWRMDRARTFPWPRWGHGVWHILTAFGILGLFLGI